MEEEKIICGKKKLRIFFYLWKKQLIFYGKKRILGRFLLLLKYSDFFDDFVDFFSFPEICLEYLPFKNTLL